MPQRLVSDSHQPDTGVRALFPQTLRRAAGSVGDGVAPAIDVDGDDLSMMIRFDLGPYVPLVNLVAEASRLFKGPAYWSRQLYVPISYRGNVLRVTFYDETHPTRTPRSSRYAYLTTHSHCSPQGAGPTMTASAPVVVEPLTGVSPRSASW